MPIAPPATTAPARPLGWWRPNGAPPRAAEGALATALADLGRPLYLLTGSDDRTLVGVGGDARFGSEPGRSDELPVRAHLPATRLASLGDAGFCADLGIRYPYLAGAMANGIASVELVQAMGRAGMLGFFGAAGLSIAAITDAIDRLADSSFPYGFNLIHSPNEPAHEAAVADLYCARGIRCVEASAFLDLTPAVVRYRMHGIHRGPDGAIVTPNRVVAKVSRVEVAEKFFAPPPAAMLQALVGAGALTAEQAALAAQVPVAQDLTAEADSGGHTDNQPALALLPTLLALRDAQQARYGFAQPLRVGLAGGISTPSSAAAAFAMGAAWVLTGSVNQACSESGTSDAVRAMLAEARQADVMMAPAADMFEMGVRVQVLKRGTMFGLRAAKLYEAYRTHAAIEAIPAGERAALETQIFRLPLDEVWAQTRAFFAERDPAEIARAEADPKHRLALVCRWYLGRSSGWANAGVPDRRVDYQIWCGPAMGAFNEWVRGTFLAAPAHRSVATVALNILTGAAVVLRGQALRSQGVAVPAAALSVRPRPLEELRACLS